MERKFAFVILDESDKIIDRYTLSVITDLGGLGFSLSLSAITTPVEDYITKIIQAKQNISFRMIQNGYAESNSFDLWLLSHINDTLALEYDDTNKIRYIEGKVVKKVKTELDKAGKLETTITFQPLSPFFIRKLNVITIKKSSEGKCYPYKYNYCYGVSIYSNNEIENKYFQDIPLIITLYGPLTNPVVTLVDEDSVVYNEVRFDNFYLKKGEKLIINGAKKKIYFDSGNGIMQDYYEYINGAYDSYLRADASIFSRININFGSGDTGYLEGSWRQYIL